LALRGAVEELSDTLTAEADAGLKYLT